MDALQGFLDGLKRSKVAEQHFLGLLHILIGRKIAREDGTPVSAGMTWRELATVLKKVRWNKDMVKQLDLEPEVLAPRDREKFWYMAISRAGVDSEQARQEGDKLAELLKHEGYVVGLAPGQKE
jgi:hypothetical protein